MCGIVGMIARTPGYELPRNRLDTMTDVLSHRGPDGRGVYNDQWAALGHRRLSIIDLSDRASQPMTSEDGRYTIVYNGEIYNYVELMSDLKSQGYAFGSRSDTEVILHLFARDGIDCLTLLNGMFSIAVWDAKERTLWLARDRVGIKPLYYHLSEDVCVFSSEIKGILASGLVTVSPNSRAIYQYVRHMYTTGEETFFEGVKRLLPGQWMSVGPNTDRKKAYWQIPFGESSNKKRSEVAEELHDLMEDAVRLRLRSDVPVGSYLSGGIDSSSIVALASKHLPKLHTFSLYFDEGPAYDERPYLRLVQEQHQTIHSDITPTADDFAKAVSSVVWWMDEPAVASPTISQHFASKLAREQVTVVLGGQGGDELFGGYYRFFPTYLKHCFSRAVRGRMGAGEALRTSANFLRHLAIVGPSQIAVKMRKHAVMHDLLTPEFNATAAHDDSAFMMEGVDISDPFDRMLYWEVKNYLPGLLHAEDRMSMSVALESRVPILDHRLVELAARIRPEYKMRNLVTKSILREAMKSVLPKPILKRMDKRGTPSPMPKWFAGPLAPLVREVLDRPEAQNRGIFDSVATKRLIDDHLSGRRDYGEQVWMLLSIELWHSTFVDRSGSDLLSPLTLG